MAGGSGPLVDPEVFFRRSTGANFREQGQKQAKLLKEGVTRGQWAHWRIRKGKKNDYVRGRIVYVRQIGDPDSHAEPIPDVGVGYGQVKQQRGWGFGSGFRNLSKCPVYKGIAIKGFVLYLDLTDACSTRGQRTRVVACEGLEVPQSGAKNFYGIIQECVRHVKAYLTAGDVYGALGKSKGVNCAMLYKRDFSGPRAGQDVREEGKFSQYPDKDILYPQVG